MRVFLILSIVGMVLCENTTTGTKTIETEWELAIKKQYRLFSENFHNKDFKALANLFTEDCIIMPPNIEIMSGRAVVRIASSLIWNEGAHTATFIPQEVIADKKGIALERGFFLLKRADNTTLDIVNYVRIWKRVNGQPKIYTNMFNSCLRR